MSRRTNSPGDCGLAPTKLLPSRLGTWATGHQHAPRSNSNVAPVKIQRSGKGNQFLQSRRSLQGQSGFPDPCEPRHSKDEPWKDRAEAHRASSSAMLLALFASHLPPSNRVPLKILGAENWGTGKRRAHLPVESSLVRAGGTGVDREKCPFADLPFPGRCRFVRRSGVGR